MLAKLAERVEEDGFLDAWLAARDEGELKQLLLHDEQSVTLRLDPGREAAVLAGRSLREDDRLTLLGEPEAIGQVRGRFEA